MNHNPVCAKCNKEMRVVKNGVGVLDMADFGPCKIWDADKWKCPTCGYEIIVGFGQGPIREHFQDDFDRVVTDYRNQNLLVECRQ
jgi:DNA-directed RNA polymerase subunit RPC12/RpoP